MFGHLFGIHEWDMHLLTYAGFQAYHQFADAWMKSRQQ